jgi:ATP-dependent RNA helicase HelY
MSGSTRFFHKTKKRKGGYGRSHRPPKIKPGADAGLKRIFAGIGVPDATPFKPDPFQIQALSAIKRSDCLVTAPTGSGKTWIAEQAIARVLKRGGRSWYASPLKALSNTKYSEFSQIFGMENVGILTGDRKEKPDAPVIVGTTEILRNQLYDAMYQGVTLLTDFVVLDEAHFLGDEDRGVVWEEIMIYLPTRIPLLLLSATIGNAKDIAKWLSSIRLKECIVVEETKRPVPLHPLFFHPSGTLFPLLSRGNPKKSRLSKKVAAYVSGSRPLFVSPPHKLPPFGDILRVLNKYRLLPAIFFLKSRADCDNALDLCDENFGDNVTRKGQRGRRIEELVAHNSHIAGHRQMWHLEQLAIGAHHSGQLPAWKLVLETLMTEGLLDAVFATSTVAAGVNFPARTIVLLNSDRFNGREFMPLSPTEFHQMTGRAGRRGMDHIGFAVAIPGKFMDIRLTAKLMSSPPSDVSSQIKINFSMVLNLLLSHTPDQIEDLLRKSFAAHQMIHAKKKQKLEQFVENDPKQLWQDFVRHLDFLKETGYAEKSGRLTGDGIWASQLRVDHPLMIAEGFRRGILPKNNPALLAAVMAMFVNERESDEKADKAFMPKALTGSILKIRKGLSSFSTRMARKGFETRPLMLSPAAMIYAWASGLPWEKVMAIVKMEEGDLCMLILRTADNLRHIRTLIDVFPEAASTAGTGVDLIMRYPVVMDYDT